MNGTTVSQEIDQLLCLHVKDEAVQLRLRTLFGFMGSAIVGTNELLNQILTRQAADMTTIGPLEQTVRMILSSHPDDIANRDRVLKIISDDIPTQEVLKKVAQQHVEAEGKTKH